MTTDYHGALDLAVLRAANAGWGDLADVAFLTLSAKWFGIVAGAAVVVLALVRGGRRRLALVVAFTLAIVLSDTGGAQVLRPLFDRMRPSYALPALVRRLGWSADVGSLPSLHASNFFAMAGIAWSLNRRIGLGAFALAAMVALSRVYLGVHWPSDVLAGAAWGLACAWAGLGMGRRIAEAIERARRIRSGS